ncbi:class I histocompatibility antigen, Gogo-A*0201 alpha chain-like [Silurus meridionalis]|uniref:class I histocompatibility antigen, Gogo-A*0201 alpha chain-like n=1 Tax=Silurus meridionalis TaxID=175797 RepID=UPI001EEA1861|nr:class I histocompatibility antigen, Gogo-A*0201 alpha chain-like [Silurus meridionalis]
MDFHWVLIKVLLVLVVIFSQTSAGTHFPEFIAVGLVDGEQFVYYDSNIRKMIPKTQWIKNLEADYWDGETQLTQVNQEDLHHLLLTVIKDMNHTKGVHTVQRMYGCEGDDDGTVRGYDQYGYNGENFIHLDLNTGSWTAANDEAEIFKRHWIFTDAEVKHRKYYLQMECIKYLRKFVAYRKNTLERKDLPETSVFQKRSFPPEVVCHATGFYPKALLISWQEDGQNVLEDVELRETLPNQDGSFQKRSILKVSAEELQKHTYTCVIEHSSLEKDLVLPVSERRILRDGGSDGGQIGIMISGLWIYFCVLDLKPEAT